MPGNRVGGLNARETRIRNLMKERDMTYAMAEIRYKYEMSMRGKLGGRKSRGGGFAYGEQGKRKAAIAGRKGGRASKRKYE